LVSGSSSGPKANDRQSLAATDIQWLIVIGQSVSHVAYSVYMANWQVGDNRTKTAQKADSTKERRRKERCNRLLIKKEGLKVR